jgi:uncharacterized membrane protein YkvA (DUF1232 family)
VRVLGRIWQQATRRERLLLGAAALYLLWPFDVFPEGLFGLVGLTDDVVALGVLLSLARRVLGRGPAP